MEKKEKRAFPPCTIHSSVHPPGASYGDKTRSRHQRCGVEAAKEGTGRGCGRIRSLSLPPLCPCTSGLFSPSLSRSPLPSPFSAAAG